MSAYIVSKRHVDALVTGATISPSGFPSPFEWNVPDADAPWGFRRERLGTDNADEVGAMLWMENVKSVRHRYPADNGNSLPGPADFTPGMADAYTFEPLAVPLTPEELLKAIQGFRYQSCEHPTWEQSEAATFIRALEQHAIASLPGFISATTWSVDDDRPVKSVYRGRARARK